MFNTRILLFILVCSSLQLFLSCQKANENIHVTKAVYYWKSSDQNLKTSEENIIDSCSIEKMYVKFFGGQSRFTFRYGSNFQVQFDYRYLYLDWNMPDEIKDSLKSISWRREIIPTVFIHNDALRGASKATLDTAASNIVYLIKKYFRKHFNPYSGTKRTLKEIQIDCD